jgi:hypothetical protein
MIGHEAIGVENEEVSRGTVDETFAHPAGRPGICEVGLAKVAADGDEVGFGAHVVLGGKAGLLSGCGHIQ